MHNMSRYVNIVYMSAGTGIGIWLHSLQSFFYNIFTDP